MQTLLETRDVAVHSEMDIVNLRHRVRQVSRAIGLDLTRQAKITAAISAVARAFMLNHNDAVFTVQVAQYPRTVLQVSCASSTSRCMPALVQLEEQLKVHEVRMLVDEFELTVIDNTVRLTMRMQLGI